MKCPTPESANRGTSNDQHAIKVLGGKLNPSEAYQIKSPALRKYHHSTPALKWSSVAFESLPLNLRSKNMRNCRR